MAADPLRCVSPAFSGQEKLKGMKVCWFLLPVVIFLVIVHRDPPMTGGSRWTITIFVLGILYAIFVGLSKGLIRLRITNLPFLFIATATCTYALYLMSLGFAVVSDEAYRYYVPLIPLMTVALVLLSSVSRSGRASSDAA